MEEININYQPLYSLGYVTCNVPSDVLTSITQEVQGLIKTNFINALPYNQYLAGAIENEFHLLNSKNILNKFFKLVIPEYWKFQGNNEESKTTYNISCHVNNLPDIWVNFQKKYEFNPLHNHTGKLSFVLYLNIPYNIEIEASLPHVKDSSLKMLPSFQFVYPRVPGQAGPSVNTHIIRVDKSWEGKMIIFPAWLQHMVTPFYTSDEYRISVSGNLIPVDNV